MRRFCLFLAAIAAPIPTAAVAAPTTIALVNATGADVSALEVRRSGTREWASVPYRAASGSSGGVTFDLADCSWDLKLTLAGGAALTYNNVNLCEAKLVTLRQKDGVAWVDFD